MNSLTIVLAVLFFSALIKSTLGFGEALLAMPLLTLIVGIQTAAPMVSLMGILLTLLILRNSWQKADLSETWSVLLAYLVGIPVGIWGLRALPGEWLTTGLGVFLVLVGLFYLLKPAWNITPPESWSLGFGLIGGMLSGAYNTGGPPLVLWGTLRHWPPENFRRNLQTCFLPAGFLTLFGHAAAGLWTSQVLSLFLYSIPVLLLGFWLGSKIQKALPIQIFEKIIYVMLVFMGVFLVL